MWRGAGVADRDFIFLHNKRSSLRTVTETTKILARLCDGLIFEGLASTVLMPHTALDIVILRLGPQGCAASRQPQDGLG